MTPEIAIVALPLCALLWRWVELYFKHQDAKHSARVKEAEGAALVFRNAAEQLHLVHTDIATMKDRLSVYEKALTNAITEFTAIVTKIEQARMSASVGAKMSQVSTVSRTRMPAP